MKPDRLNITIASLILALLAGQGVSEATMIAAPVIASAPVRADSWRKDLDLQHWSTATFHADLSGAIVALSEAHGAEQSVAMLDIAEIFLTHMLLYEATTTLDGIEPNTPYQTQRFLALRHAASLLAGETIEDFDASPLNGPERPDRDFWMSLQAIAIADVDMLNISIKSSFAGLGLQSRAVLRQMLPVFVEASTELGHQAYAAAALRLMEELPDLANSSTGYFLRGRAEERRGNESSALEAYFLAAAGWDQYAARARLAVADMSLRNGGRGALLAAQSLLSAGSEAWRGDRFELEVLKRMVRLYAATDDDVKGLLTLGKMLSRFPASKESSGGQEQAQKLLSEIYRKGGDGQYALSDWIDMHLSLLPFFRDFPQFPGHTEELGDYVLELGATDLAAKEYQRAIQLIETRGGPALPEVKADMIRLNLKLADAQWRAGLSSKARVTLDMLGMPIHNPERDAFNALKAKILTDLNDGPALLKTVVDVPTPNHLREMGKALTEAGEWSASSDVFLRLWDGHPQDFSLEDATRLLVAANRSKDAATIDKVARAFPQLTSSKAMIELAESLNTQAVDLLPLSAKKVADRLRSLDEAFQSIKNTSISP